MLHTRQDRSQGDCRQGMGGKTQTGKGEWRYEERKDGKRQAGSKAKARLERKDMLEMCTLHVGEVTQWRDNQWGEVSRGCRSVGCALGGLGDDHKSG